MPLTINVGLSRKLSKNYNSQGASINLTAELDPSLLARPDDLQGAIDELYEQADYALVRQTHRAGYGHSDQKPVVAQHNGTNGNGHAQARNGRAPDPADRGMTPSQRHAVFAIAEQLGIDPVDEARHEFGIDLDHASLGEASRLIDHLKSLQFSHRNGHHG